MEPISISTCLIVTLLGFLCNISMIFAEAYELPAPVSMRARVVMPSTLTNTTGNTPSPTPLAVIATFFLSSSCGLSHIDVWCLLSQCWHEVLLWHWCSMTSYCAVKTQPFLHQDLLAVWYGSDFHVLGGSVIVVDTLDTFSGHGTSLPDIIVAWWVVHSRGRAVTCPPGFFISKCLVLQRVDRNPMTPCPYLFAQGLPVLLVICEGSSRQSLSSHLISSAFVVTEHNMSASHWTLLSSVSLLMRYMASWEFPFHMLSLSQILFYIF